MLEDEDVARGGTGGRMRLSRLDQRQGLAVLRIGSKVDPRSDLVAETGSGSSMY